MYNKMLSGGANRWTDWVKEFASKNNLSYGCALSTPACKTEYRAKYGVKMTKKQQKEFEKEQKENEKMGAEDKNVAVKRIKPPAPPNTPAPISNATVEAVKARERARHRERVVELKSKLNKNLALSGIVQKGKELQERNEMGAEDINRAKKKIRVKKPKQNIRLVIEEDEPEPEPAVKKRGRPKKYATAEEARQMKIKKTIEASKRRQAKKREEKAEAKASKKKPKFIIENDSDDEQTGKGFDPLPDFKDQVASAEGGMINPLSDPVFAEKYFKMKEGMSGGHWTTHMLPHLKSELSNYENIAHHLGQHLGEKGAKDPKDITGFHHFSREAERIKKLLARI